MTGFSPGLYPKKDFHVPQASKVVYLHKIDSLIYKPFLELALLPVHVYYIAIHS